MQNHADHPTGYGSHQQAIGPALHSCRVGRSSGWISVAAMVTAPTTAVAAAALATVALVATALAGTLAVLLALTNGLPVAGLTSWLGVGLNGLGLNSLDRRGQWIGGRPHFIKASQFVRDVWETRAARYRRE